MKRCSVITIDGPAGAGKSTLAKKLASKLGFFVLDTGAIYRVLALHLLDHGISPESGNVPAEILNTLDLKIEPSRAAMRLFLAGREVTDQIRNERIGNAASVFSMAPEVRSHLLSIQREAGRQWNLVAEGRDMGTVVFPDAPVKFFLVARLEERSRRRFKELLESGLEPDYETVLAEMRARDKRDETRAAAPLKQASDAVRIDSSNLRPDEVLELMLTHVASNFRA
jgi:CMP/dCMP kinase